jgi:hypothetical protein
MRGEQSGFTGFTDIHIYIACTRRRDCSRGGCRLSVKRCTLTGQALAAGGTLAGFGSTPSDDTSRELARWVKDSRASPSTHDTCPIGEVARDASRQGLYRNMAAMMPSSATSGNPYDDDAVERDLIDPDDGASHAAAAVCLPLQMYTM